MDKRKIALQQWVTSLYPNHKIKIEKLADDASFRRYFRIHLADETLVAMDAPPEKEDTHSFMAIADALIQQNINAPRIEHKDNQQGFLLMTDFGDDSLLSRLTPENVDDYYSHAIDTILKMQSITQANDYTIPIFDKPHIQQELDLFEQWFLGEYLNISLNAKQKAQLQGCFEVLMTNLTQQPQVFIHRDFHSRNLMVLRDQCLGVIDFQDAMIGPSTYDLVSLLKDCYIEWPDNKLTLWLKYFHSHGFIQEDFEQLKKDFDFSGIQRHIKVLGIFCRLSLRDKKSRYLQDLPLTLKYCRYAAEKYSELDNLSDLLRSINLP